MAKQSTVSGIPNQSVLEEETSMGNGALPKYKSSCCQSVKGIRKLVLSDACYRGQELEGELPADSRAT